MRILAVFASFVAFLFASVAPAAGDKVEFADVRSLLEERCYDCHGPKTQEGSLRLSHKRMAFAGGDGGPVIVPGKSDESRLIAWVTGGHDGKVMPPEDYDDPLEDDEVALLRNWRKLARGG
jgi:mono/diheme cytochrome c family protein